MPPGHWNVLIVGIGPAGLAVALSLLKHPNTPFNVRLTLIDASPTLSPSGAVGLTRNGLHVLSELGVHPDGQFVRAIFVNDPVSKKTLQALSVPKGATLMVERFELAQQLLEEVKKVGGERVEVLWSKKFKSAEDLDGGTVRVELEGGELMDVDLLVGADGVRSKVRDFVLGEGDWTPFFTGYMSVYGVSKPIEGANDHEHVGASRFIIDRQGIGGYESWDLPQRRQYWHIMSVSDHPRGTASAPRPTPEDITQELEQYQSAWHPIPGGFAAIINATTFERVIKTPILSRFYEKLHNDRGTAVLVGDAAHPLIPALGQGVNMGLEDAIVLANALLSVTQDAIPLGTAWYTSQRVERLRKVGDQSAFIVKIVMGESMMWRWIRHLGILVSRLLPRPKDYVEWDVIDEITSEQAAMGPFGWIHGWKVKLGE